MKKATLNKILEELFDRGYLHGVSGGLSDDGEFYAVRDTKIALKKLKKGKK